MTSVPITSRPPSRTRWPMTAEAWSRLVDEIAQLRAELREPDNGQQDDNLVQLPARQAARRLETLSAVLEASEQTDEGDRCVIGRRVTLREDDGTEVRYWLVFPGDGDPGNGWVSADSPLGAAILGARRGDSVAVAAPAGERSVSVVAVE